MLERLIKLTSRLPSLAAGTPTKYTDVPDALGAIQALLYVGTLMLGLCGEVGNGGRLVVVVERGK